MPQGQTDQNGPGCRRHRVYRQGGRIRVRPAGLQHCRPRSKCHVHHIHGRWPSAIRRFLPGRPIGRGRRGRCRRAHKFDCPSGRRKWQARREHHIVPGQPHRHQARGLCHRLSGHVELSPSRSRRARPGQALCVAERVLLPQSAAAAPAGQVKVRIRNGGTERHDLDLGPAHGLLQVGQRTAGGDPGRGAVRVVWRWSRHAVQPDSRERARRIHGQHHHRYVQAWQDTEHWRTGRATYEPNARQYDVPEPGDGAQVRVCSYVVV
mmetsp:Transcript_17153/g.40681  ORF Transcript_17153/g.40681 Transcript_17153/m.40681 type:complete len:264 (-) Transcript_17153:408-1199(-)